MNNAGRKYSREERIERYGEAKSGPSYPVGRRGFSGGLDLASGSTQHESAYVEVSNQWLDGHAYIVPHCAQVWDEANFSDIENTILSRFHRGYLSALFYDSTGAWALIERLEKQAPKLKLEAIPPQVQYQTDQVFLSELEAGNIKYHPSQRDLSRHAGNSRLEENSKGEVYISHGGPKGSLPNDAIKAMSFAIKGLKEAVYRPADIEIHVGNPFYGGGLGVFSKYPKNQYGHPTNADDGGVFVRGQWTPEGSYLEAKQKIAAGTHKYSACRAAQRGNSCDECHALLIRIGYHSADALTQQELAYAIRRGEYD